MTIDVLSIGAFPEATNAELANRFALELHRELAAQHLLNRFLRSTHRTPPAGT